MRNTRWLRYGLASIIVAGTGLGATLIACGDDDASSSSGSVPSEASPSETGTSDTGVDAAKVDAGKKAPAKLTFVNATTDMGPNAALNARGDAAIRICFAQGTTTANLGIAPYPPLPDKPKGTQTVAGVFYGTGGAFPSFGLDLEPRIVVPYVMNVRSLLAKGIVNPGTGDPGHTCDELIGDLADASVGFQANIDYWKLPQIDAGTLKADKSFILVLSGCVGDATITNKDKCGANPPAGGTPGVGNLKVTILETNRTPVSATQLGVQVFHASTAANAIFGAIPYPLSPGFTSNPADAGPSFKAATGAAIVVNQLTPAQGVTGVKDSDYFVLDKVNPSPGATTALAPLPLPLIQALSGLGLPAAPTVYKDGANFVFLPVGDPQAFTFQATDGGCTLEAKFGCGDGGDGTSFNTRSLHFLAFPTDPTIVDYKP